MCGLSSTLGGKGEKPSQNGINEITMRLCPAPASRLGTPACPKLCTSVDEIIREITLLPERRKSCGVERIGHSQKFYTILEKILVHYEASSPKCAAPPIGEFWEDEV